VPIIPAIGVLKQENVNFEATWATQRTCDKKEQTNKKENFKPKENFRFKNISDVFIGWAECRFKKYNGMQVQEM
jgi:hypothetical protein